MNSGFDWDWSGEHNTRGVEKGREGGEVSAATSLVAESKGTPAQNEPGNAETPKMGKRGPQDGLYCKFICPKQGFILCVKQFLRTKPAPSSVGTTTSQPNKQGLKKS